MLMQHFTLKLYSLLLQPYINPYTSKKINNELFLGARFLPWAPK